MRAFVVACRKHRKDAIHLLLRHGVSINAQDDKVWRTKMSTFFITQPTASSQTGMTIFLAQCQSQEDTVEDLAELVAVGANVQEVDKVGACATSVAMSSVV